MADRDLYDVLGLSRSAGDDEIKKAYRTLARQLPPRREPRRSRGRGTVQGSAARVRDAARSRTPPAVRRVRRRRRPCRCRRRRGDFSGAGDFGLNDLFDAFFGGDAFGGPAAAAATGPARGADAEMTIELTLARHRVRRAQDRRAPHAGRVRHLRGERGRAGHAPRTLPDVRRSRRGAPGPALPARSARHRGAVPGVRRNRSDPAEPVRDLPRRWARARDAHASTSMCRRASTTASGSASRSAARPRRAVACRATST